MNTIEANTFNSVEQDDAGMYSANFLMPTLVR